MAARESPAETGEVALPSWAPELAWLGSCPPLCASVSLYFLLSPGKPEDTSQVRDKRQHSVHPKVAYLLPGTYVWMKQTKILVLTSNLFPEATCRRRAEQLGASFLGTVSGGGSVGSLRWELEGMCFLPYPESDPLLLHKPFL